MRSMLKKATGLILAAALTFSLAAPAAAAGSSRTGGTSATLAAVRSTVTETALPQQGWQAQVTFPDWAGYVDDTLAMNSLYSFDGYADQGELYVTLAAGVTGLRLFVNNAEVDTSAMKGGSTYKVDISGLTVNGTNTVQVSAITPSTLTGAVTVSIPYPTVITGLPSDVGMSADILGVIDDFIASEVKYGFSGAQLAVVKDGKMVYSNAWGAVNGYNPDGTRIEEGDENYVPVTTDTLYDLASNTKMYATNYAIQYLVAHSKNYNNFSINDPITKYFPDFVNNTIEIKYDTANGTGAPDLETAKAWKAELTVADILQHQAGFAPDPQFYNDQFNQVTQTPDPNTDNVLYAIGKEAVAEAICKAPLVYEPGTKTVYSDVDYMLLGLIVEQVTGKDLNTFLKEHPDGAYKGARGTIALTGYNGVFGYRTDSDYQTKQHLTEDQQKWLDEHPDFDYDADIAGAKQIAEALKKEGWDFASHTWGHLSVTGKTVDQLRTDNEKWMDNVADIVGATDTIIFAHGNDIGSWEGYSSDNEVYQYFKGAGYNFYCNVDGSQPYWVQITDQYVRQGRIDLDGYMLYRASTGQTTVLDNMFKASEVFDQRRPTPVIANGES